MTNGCYGAKVWNPCLGWDNCQQAEGGAKGASICRVLGALLTTIMWITGFIISRPEIENWDFYCFCSVVWYRIKVRVLLIHQQYFITKQSCSKTICLYIHKNVLSRGSFSIIHHVIYDRIMFFSYTSSCFAINSQVWFVLWSHSKYSWVYIFCHFHHPSRNDRIKHHRFILLLFVTNDEISRFMSFIVIITSSCVSLFHHTSHHKHWFPLFHTSLLACPSFFTSQITSFFVAVGIFLSYVCWKFRLFIPNVTFSHFVDIP